MFDAMTITIQLSPLTVTTYNWDSNDIQPTSYRSHNSSQLELFLGPSPQAQVAIHYPVNPFLEIGGSVACHVDAVSGRHVAWVVLCARMRMKSLYYL